MELEDVLEELLERLELPELEELCKHRWVLELVIKLCDIRQRNETCPHCLSPRR